MITFWIGVGVGMLGWWIVMLLTIQSCRRAARARAELAQREVVARATLSAEVPPVRPEVAFRNECHDYDAGSWQWIVLGCWMV